MPTSINTEGLAGVNFIAPSCCGRSATSFNLRPLAVVRILLACGVDVNARDDEGWSAWHVAASWRSYNLLREILRTHDTSVELDAKTNDGATAHRLSQDEDFYKKLMSN